METAPPSAADSASASASNDGMVVWLVGAGVVWLVGAVGWRWADVMASDLNALTRNHSGGDGAGDPASPAIFILGA